MLTRLSPERGPYRSLRIRNYTRNAAGHTFRLLISLAMLAVGVTLCLSGLWGLVYYWAVPNGVIMIVVGLPLITVSLRRLGLRRFANRNADPFY